MGTLRRSCPKRTRRSRNRGRRQRHPLRRAPVAGGKSRGTPARGRCAPRHTRRTTVAARPLAHRRDPRDPAPGRGVRAPRCHSTRDTSGHHDPQGGTVRHRCASGRANPGGNFRATSACRERLRGHTPATRQARRRGRRLSDFHLRIDGGTQGLPAALARVEQPHARRHPGPEHEPGGSQLPDRLAQFRREPVRNLARAALRRHTMHRPRRPAHGPACAARLADCPSHHDPFQPDAARRGTTGVRLAVTHTAAHPQHRRANPAEAAQCHRSVHPGQQLRPHRDRHRRHLVHRAVR
ncbi:MAG: hypothetical protein BWX86_00311 [Verrucomicrobia bacterium ADurb.Bin122]|nr:MAG: hypothetical protein BWX86_00311 [Verrucomicrobia bacterium ADurb.Bin122]